MSGPIAERLIGAFRRREIYLAASPKDWTRPRLTAARSLGLERLKHSGMAANARLHLLVQGREFVSILFDGQVQQLTEQFDWGCGAVLEDPHANDASPLAQARSALVTPEGHIFFRHQQVGAWWFEHVDAT
jgi:hypothetical protein